MHSTPITAGLSAAGLVCGYGAAVASGSRPLGGVVLAGFAAACVLIWLRRDGRRAACRLTACGLMAFVASHALGPLTGPWAAVLLVAAAMAGTSWQLSDRHHRRLRSTRPAVAD